MNHANRTDRTPRPTSPSLDVSALCRRFSLAFPQVIDFLDEVLPWPWPNNQPWDESVDAWLKRVDSSQALNLLSELDDFNNIGISDPEQEFVAREAFRIDTETVEAAGGWQAFRDDLTCRVQRHCWTVDSSE